MNEILKEESRIFARELRLTNHMTQAEMAAELHMATRSYADIELGMYACGQLTLLLLLMKSDDPGKFLQRVDKQFSALNLRKEASA